MPQPQPITDDLVEELNALYGGGVIMPQDIGMARLKRRIESLSTIESGIHRGLISAYYGLIGHWDEMRKHGLAATRMCMNDDVRILYATILVNTGFFSEASEMLEQANWSCPYLTEKKLELCNECSLYSRMIDYTLLCKKANMPPPEHINMQIAQAARDILTANNVSENTVNAMLDIAGGMMRERGLLRKYDLTVTPYPEDGTVTIMQPVRATALLVAEMDWEYAERLFARIPDAPATVVHIGFTMVYDA